MKIIFSNSEFKWKEIKPDEVKFSNGQNNTKVIIDSSKRYQSHLGFGGAFTDSTVFNYLKLNDEQKEEIVNALFSKDGLKYNLGRYPIQSTDFSVETYYYIKSDDKDFSSFSLKNDANRLSFTKKCIKIADNLILFAVSWTPLPFMKTNKNPYYGGKLLKRFYQPWADYLCLCLKEYEKAGMHVDVISAQNEPQAVQVWESCIYDEKDEGTFLSKYLIPTLRKNGLDTKIAIWDHNRDIIVNRIKDTLRYIDINDVYAIAYHWYDHKDFKNLSAIHDMCPNIHLLLTECCVELGIYKDGIGNLNHAELYAHEIINDFNNYSEGYIDWNMVLDINGGPNHVNNLCEAPILIDDNNQIRYLPTYYYIGHFSKYISRGDIRLFSSSDNPNIELVAYLHDDSITAVIMNKGDEDTNAQIYIDDKELSINLIKHSIYTIIF